LPRGNNNRIYIMVRTVYLNNEFDIKELSKETSREKINFTNCYGENVEYGRYISSAEFRKQAIKKVNNFCDKHGIL